MGKVGAAPTQVVAGQFKFVNDEMYKILGKLAQHQLELWQDNSSGARQLIPASWRK